MYSGTPELKPSAVWAKVVLILGWSQFWVTSVTGTLVTIRSISFLHILNIFTIVSDKELQGKTVLIYTSYLLWKVKLNLSIQCMYISTCNVKNFCHLLLTMTRTGLNQRHLFAKWQFIPCQFICHIDRFTGWINEHEYWPNLQSWYG